MQPCNDKTNLYIISPEKFELEEFLPRLQIALTKHKPALFQLRVKDENFALKAAKPAIEICRTHNVPLILNDYIDIAKEVGADGIHLGEEAEKYEEARAVLGAGAHIGISCYADVARAIEFAEKGANLVSFGQFHPTKTKPAKGWATPETIREFVETRNPKLETKSAAIGGLNFENKAPVEAVGVDYICMVSAIWDNIN